MAHASDLPPAPRRARITAHRGRPRIYSSAAEKQRVYRQRVRQKLAALMAQREEDSQPLTSPLEGKPRTGRDLLQALTANGFVGAWADRDDIGDSVEFARQLRERVWSRETG